MHLFQNWHVETGNILCDIVPKATHSGAFFRGKHLCIQMYPEIYENSLVVIDKFSVSKHTVEYGAPKGTW